MSNSGRVLEIRTAVRDHRKKLSSDEVQEKSSAIRERFAQSHMSRKLFQGLEVCAYRSLGDEVDLSQILQDLLDQGASLSFPKITDFGQKTLEMVAVNETDLSAVGWKQNKYGIEEPPGRKVLSPKSIDVILVPGTAFGISGERLGRGSGYYDRYLQKTDRALRVSFCFDFQVFPALEQEVHDQPIDWILTEKREFLNHRAKEFRSDLRK